ncbi:hypothetical protein EE612_057033 [Oryza sativa]|nr:hypothetical protein EE612_057033 [Oryza sativa]
MPRRRSSSLITRSPLDSGGRASGSGGGDRGLVIHRVVKDGGGPVNYPLLTKTNCNDWALLMKIKLQARNLWSAIEPDGVEVAFHEDRMALDAICSAGSARDDRDPGDQSVSPGGVGLHQDDACRQRPHLQGKRRRCVRSTSRSHSAATKWWKTSHCASPPSSTSLLLSATRSPQTRSSRNTCVLRVPGSINLFFPLKPCSISLPCRWRKSPVGSRRLRTRGRSRRPLTTAALCI